MEQFAGFSRKEYLIKEGVGETEFAIYLLEAGAEILMSIFSFFVPPRKPL